MNLPFVVDIAVGLIFTYLILSLLASEIQELITTIFQWRAEHLKNSIETLLSSGQASSDVTQIRGLVDRMYANPLIKSLNQEAKGKFAIAFRKVANGIISTTSKLLGTKHSFPDNTSAPSHIPPEVFASTLIETFKLNEVGRVVTLGRMEEFKEKQIQEIVNAIETVDLSEGAQTIVRQELETLRTDWQQMTQDYNDKRSSLSETLDRMRQRLDTYLSNCQLYVEKNESYFDIFVYRIQAIRDNTYNDTERQVLQKSLKPSINEVVNFVHNKAQVYAELERAVQDRESPTYQGIRQVIDTLPDLPEPVRNSLSTLSNRIRTTKDSIEDEIDELQTHIEQWFDSSMNRSAGVYRRNARGIGILIGILVAVSANADTLYITSSLSKDTVLREALTENAGQILQPGTSSFGVEELKTVAEDVKDSLDVADLPLGWTPYLISEQAQANQTGGLFSYLKRVFGWVLSGFAIAMGSSFWFDLLGKIVNVRNIGSPK